MVGCLQDSIDLGGSSGNGNVWMGSFYNCGVGRWRQGCQFILYVVRWVVGLMCLNGLP